MNKVKFKQWNTVAKFGEYGNGRVAIDLIDAEDYAPIARATVNIPEIKLKKNEIIIKDYSENKGMLYALIDAGMVEPTNRQVRTGYAICPIAKLLVNEEGETL